MAAPDFSYSDLGLEKMVAKVSLFRLILFFLLLIPLALLWTEDVRMEGYFIPHRAVLFTFLMLLGFSISIFYLVTWKKWNRLRLFFLLQLITDILLTTFLVFIAGGIKSNFVFLFLGIIFLYGRILGFKSALYSCAGILLCIQAVAWVQFNWPDLWAGQGMRLYQVFYLLFLQSLGLVLTLILVRIGRGREEHLVLRLLQHEVALEESEKLKKQVFDWMESGLVVTNSQGRISAVNRTALNGARLSRDEVLKKPLRDIFPELSRFWKSGMDDGLLREMHSKDGCIYAVRISGLPAGQGYLLIFSDVTEMRKLEKQVFQMEKLATTGELAAGLAHEMKNPLAGIKAALQLTGQNKVDPGTARRLQDVIERDINRLDNLLRDFLVFARPKGSQRTLLDLQETVEQCVDIVRGQYPEIDINLSSRIKGKKWKWDVGQLHQVVLNLLLNAAQAALSARKPRVAVDFALLSGDQNLLITDNGPGILPETQERIFDPFFTTKPRGSGLGLAIAQRLAAQNGSRIELESGNESGTTARIVHNIDSGS
ncbi:MAG: two-component system sensor histidine kinase NtrB [Thermodesulfobacteriota bacterium]